jgi:hypothetical protein
LLERAEPDRFRETRASVTKSAVGVEVAESVDLVRQVSRQQRLDVSRHRDVVVRPGAAVPIGVEIHTAQPAVAVRGGLARGGGDDVGRRGGVVDVQHRAIGIAEKDDVLLGEAEELDRRHRFALAPQTHLDAVDVTIGDDDHLDGVAGHHSGTHAAGRHQRLVVRVRSEDHDGLRGCDRR